ncbi:MAG TPA: pilus assembly protein PilM, partial [Candidatus Acidoferrales bacterium]|nr:pilus assembly protein PilM [Candidatus Acidoferrales bacterium]
MALPFLNGLGQRKKARVVSVDLGTRVTKAVQLDLRGESWALSRFVIQDAPISDKKISPDLLAEHLKNVIKALGSDSKAVTLSIGLDDALLRQVELPQIPLSEMRLVLKNNTKAYLQQDLPGHVYDCHIFPPKPSMDKSDDAKSASLPKLKVLVSAASPTVVNNFQTALKGAGFSGDYIVPGFIGGVNAFEMALPEVFKNETVALVDIGFQHTSICVLDNGEPALMRVVNIGGDTFTAGLAEMMSISYAEAEGIKVGMAPEVLSALELHVLPLGRELRASLDFFEHQADRAVTQVYLSGGSTRSEMILQMLRSELVVECKTWSPTGFLKLALP